MQCGGGGIEAGSHLDEGEQHLARVDAQAGGEDGAGGQGLGGGEGEVVQGGAVEEGEGEAQPQGLAQQHAGDEGQEAALVGGAHAAADDRAVVVEALHAPGTDVFLVEQHAINSTLLNDTTRATECKLVMKLRGIMQEGLGCPIDRLLLPDLEKKGPHDNSGMPRCSGLPFEELVKAFKLQCTRSWGLAGLVKNMHD